MGETRTLLLARLPRQLIADRTSLAASLVLLLGCALLVVPTMLDVARFSWSTEQGGHGPIVLVTGIWLLQRELREAKIPFSPPSLWPGVLGLAACIFIYLLARITGILEIEALAMYGALIMGTCLLVGWKILKLWFPLLYLALTLPPPDSVVAFVTQPIKIAISQTAVLLLHNVGYPIASSGAKIQIAQYELLVAAACAGLNSIVSLAAVCLFYVYLMHRNNLLAFVVIIIAVIPVAIFSNFIRVIVLILITYYFGEAAAQGFMHDFAGLLMFAVALATIFGIDSLYSRLAKLWKKSLQ